METFLIIGYLLQIIFILDSTCSHINKFLIHDIYFFINIESDNFTKSKKISQLLNIYDHPDGKLKIHKAKIL